MNFYNFKKAKTCWAKRAEKSSYLKSLLNISFSNYLNEEFHSFLEKFKDKKVLGLNYKIGINICLLVFKKGGIIKADISLKKLEGFEKKIKEKILERKIKLIDPSSDQLNFTKKDSFDFILVRELIYRLFNDLFNRMVGQSGHIFKKGGKFIILLNNKNSPFLKIFEKERESKEGDYFCEIKAIEKINTLFLENNIKPEKKMGNSFFFLLNYIFNYKLGLSFSLIISPSFLGLFKSWEVFNKIFNFIFLNKKIANHLF